MTETVALRTRRSIRRYHERPLAADIVAALRAEIDTINHQQDLNMQLVTDEPHAFRSFLAYGKFSGVSNYVMVVGRKDDTLDYRAGYGSESFVLRAKQLGLGTCIVGMTYRKVSGTFTLGADERVVVCIAVGYPAEEGRPHKVRALQQVSNVGADTPSWFSRGVEAALMAPTAVNQQKFYFEYIAPQPGEDKARVRPAAPQVACRLH